MAALPPNMPRIESGSPSSPSRSEASAADAKQARSIQSIGEAQSHEVQEAPQLKDIKSMHSFKVLTGDSKARLKEGALNVVDKGSKFAQNAFSKIVGIASGLIGKIKGTDKKDEWVVTGDDLKWQSVEEKENDIKEEAQVREDAPVKDSSKAADMPEEPVDAKQTDAPRPKKEASKEDLDQLAAKMKEIRAKRAERKNLKEEVQKARDSESPAIQKSIAEKKEGRYKQKVVEEGKHAVYSLGKHQVVGGKKVYSAPKSEISLDNIEKVAANLIKANDRAGIRKLCNSIFFGPHGTSTYTTKVPEIAALRMLLSDPDSNLNGVEKLIRNGAEKWRKEYKPATALTKENGENYMKAYQTPTWAKDPEAWIEISHGGGAENIRDFVEGRSDGYKLENFGTGIQVSPNFNDRDNMYAQKVYGNFDTPAIFKARIQAKYLQQAPNGYEAGLIPENVKYLENVTVERAPFTGGTPPSPDFSSLEAEYGKDLAKQVRDSYENIQKRERKPYSDEELKRIGADYPKVVKYTKTETGEFISGA